MNGRMDIQVQACRVEAYSRRWVTANVHLLLLPAYFLLSRSDPGARGSI
jgi:hypothetical protein